MPEGRCLICGKPLHDTLSVYCPECEYELKRVRLADEETLEEWLERMESEKLAAAEKHNVNITPLTNFE